MTAVDLDAIRHREQAATEGPWTDQGSWNTQTYRSVLAGLVTSTGNHAADAAFIRHARTDVPAMADEIEQLRGRLAAVERYAEELRADARTEPNDALAVGLLRAADGLGDLFAGAVTE